MQPYTKRFALAAMGMALVLCVAGCQGPPIDKTLQAEELLGTAGFKLKMADTPVKLERIKKLPQQQVVRGTVKDREVYVWADAAGCRCYYSGTRQNYENLIALREQDETLRHLNLYDNMTRSPMAFDPDWEDELLGR